MKKNLSYLRLLNIIWALCGYSLMVKLQPSKLIIRVRFPLPAPFLTTCYNIFPMKARSITKTALSVLVLAFAGTLSGVAQQAASPSAVPAVDHVKASAAEKVFIQRMAATVEAGRKSGALDMKAVSAVLDSAVKAGVSDAVMAQMVSMAAGAFPANAPQVASAAVKSYGTRVTEANVRNIVSAAVSVQPKPYASVSPICVAVTKALGHSPVAMTMSSIAVEVAAETPDNPLQGVTTQAHGLIANPGEDAATGALVMPGGIPVGGTPTSPAPVSNPSGN